MDLDLLDHLGSAMLLSNKLAFLGKLKASSDWPLIWQFCCTGKYREFHRLYGNGEFVAAGQLLVQLLVSNIVPMKYVVLWVCLCNFALCVCAILYVVLVDVKSKTSLLLDSG